jgi:hypothetical protein
MKHVLALFAGTLGLLAALIVLKWSLEDRAAPTTSGIGGALREAPFDLLFVGSSHTRQSYDVLSLEHQTGRSAFLVAYNGLDFRLMAEVVPDLLAEKRLRPRLLVLEGYAVSLVRPEGLEDSRLFFDAPPALKRRLLADVMSQHTGLSRYLDAFDLVANRNNELLLTYPVQSFLANRLSYRGGYIDKRVPGLRDFSGITLPDEPATPSPAELAALADGIDAARRAGVRVVCMGSPMPGPVEREPAIRALKGSLRAFLFERGVPYLDGAVGFPIDDPGLFADSNHLSTEGRELYTRNAGAFLNRILAGITDGADREARTAPAAGSDAPGRL